ncbi:MAG: histidinol-phosphatase [Actinomycetota bacterium]|nr:histidinol-phosphatase [Actinomycetota bacterium]
MTSRSVTDDPALKDDLALALLMADAADGLAMGRFRAADLAVETKPDLTPVTEADRAVEQSLRAMLAAQRPGDSVLGEEYGTAGASPRRWILDPIDGTKNYVRGVPVWATLIALLDGDEVTVGVVSAPALGRRWWAALGHGAYMSEPGRIEHRRLQASRVSRLADASLSLSDEVGWAERGSASGLVALKAGTWRQRGYGDFWSHMLVAEGAVDVAAEPALQSYDVAALVPIVVEAGGRISSFDGGPAVGGGSAVTTNGVLHDEVLALLAAGA